jgi:L-alanine-DL-glutamate epimerase-like enolase superfamily enzyme
MIIKHVEFFRLDMGLSEPYTIAYETVSSATNIILKITTDTGITGWGCAAPDLTITGETPEDVTKLTETLITDLLIGESPFRLARVNSILKERVPGAKSSIAMADMALHDIMARKAGIPLYQLLGGFRDSIPTSITIGIMGVEDTVKQAGKYLDKGFFILKLKGGISLSDDIEKVMKVREKLGRKFRIRFDANQGYSFEESVEFIKRTKSASIEIFEQPTSLQKDEKMGEVTRSVEVPVMADESMKTLKDAFRLVRNDTIDMVNIKLMKVGGIMESGHINSVAKAAGMEVMVGCLDECALGISAGLHFALSRPNIEFADLDGHLDLLGDPFSGLFVLDKGVLYPSGDEGLGKVNI